MSNVAPVIIKTNPHRPVDFKESALAKVLKESGNLNVEVKEDGCQVNIVVYYETMEELGKGWTVLFLSREGKEFNGLRELGAKLSRDERWLKVFNEHLEAGLFAENGGFLLQAEVLTIGDDGKYKPCAEIAGDLRRMQPIPLDRLRFVAFDIIPFDAVRSGKDYEVFQEVRTGHMLHQITAITNRFPELNIRPVATQAAYSLEHLTALYETARHNSKEGVVAKDPLGHWKRGKKTGQWKVKPDDSCDGVVTGLMWGTPGLANEGKVIGFTVLTEHGIEVEAGGITEAQKDEFSRAVAVASFTSDNELGHHGPNEIRSGTLLYRVGDIVNPYDGWACKINYMERLPSGSYRHPSFDSFRGITDPKIKE
ncbi:DNA ligase [Pseudomonas phage phi15]|uniref:DNA ligase n=1 Tax=Pseudomonas phage phi15 TaxID=988656 RepID=F0V6X3_9CAUD|nr:DNA ligase [Pseudomonas phage phi15]CBZ41985.1 putative DNA ligase [Pseudomonas phage phi15]